ncbi:MAG: tRNA pseudouridine(38-40) synthase TruA [Candidatus Accumulibacter sp.]|nr:tRNA pseudouridine(38-40) synthase TruA [Accumulibacter sp.]
MRLALGLEYDGSCFRGWQQQPGGGTVQDALQEALSQFAVAPIKVICAGRTDAGVHALGQIVHFDTDLQRLPHAWIRGANTFLPPAVAVRWVQAVSDNFHARASACARHYRYVLINRAYRPGVWHRRIGWYHHRLDVAAMRTAAACLLGEHDFSAFRAAECQAVSPVKTMHRVDIRRLGELIVFDFEASAFLHHMVRNLVGSLVCIGQGKKSPDWLTEVLLHGDRRQAAATFPPDGLYLMEVKYADWDFPSADEIDFLPALTALGFPEQ